MIIGSPQVHGDLDKNILKRHIKLHLPKVQYCYEHELQGKPTLDGTVTVQFLVGEDGLVISSTASGVDDKVASCIAGVFKAIEFPAAKFGSRVQVNYPITLHPNVVIEENR